MLAENMQNGMVRLKEGGEGQGLFPVLQPSGNPYAETHPTGDAWLQSMWKEGEQLPCLVVLFSASSASVCVGSGGNPCESQWA